MKFCSTCGDRVTLSIPQGDNRKRHICVNQQCETIHYQNPRIITGCLPIFEEKILLCKRAIEPQYGKWTLPAGFMENGESTEDGAIRESMEEANASLTVDSLYAIYNLPYINQVYFFYKATLNNMNFSAGEESLDVQLFEEEDVPWQDLAFSVIGETLKYYFDDRKTHTYPLHHQTINKKL